MIRRLVALGLGTVVLLASAIEVGLRLCAGLVSYVVTGTARPFMDLNTSPEEVWYTGRAIIWLYNWARGNADA